MPNKPLIDEDALVRAQRLCDTGEQLSLGDGPANLVLGGIYSLRDDGIPVGVWLQQQVETTLRHHGLWCDGATLAVDVTYSGADWDDDSNATAWDVELEFILWGDEALYSGTVTARLIMVGSPPPRHEDDESFFRVEKAVLAITRVGRQAALPIESPQFIDSEEGLAESESFRDKIHTLGCLLAVVSFCALAILGLVVSVDWILGRLIS